jgi:hypothetical protein
MSSSGVRKESSHLACQSRAKFPPVEASDEDPIRSDGESTAWTK